MEEKQRESKHDEDLREWSVKFAERKPAEAEIEEKGDDRTSAIRRACDFYYENSEFEEELKRWSLQRCDAFEDQETSGGDGEYSLEHYQIFDDFRNFLERKLSEFVQHELGMTPAEFFDLVASDIDKKDDAYSATTFIALINAAQSFEAFQEMMVDAKLGVFTWGIPPLVDNETGEVFV